MISSRLGPAALAALACAAWAASAAAAGSPSPPNCTVDHVIIASFDNRGALAGPSPCTAPAQPGFDVWVRDGLNLPVPGAQVTVVFSGTGTGIHPYKAQNPGVTVDCTRRALSVFADANGHAVMVPRFGGSSHNGAPSIPVYANGQFLQYVAGLSCDYDDDGVVSLADFSRFTTDFTSPVVQPESDFDDCPSTLLGDFGFFAEQYLWDQGRPVEPMCP